MAFKFFESSKDDKKSKKSSRSKAKPMSSDKSMVMDCGPSAKLKKKHGLK